MAPTAGECTMTLQGHTSSVYCVACVTLSDGTSRRAISGSWDETLRVWDLPAEEQGALASPSTATANATAQLVRATAGSDAAELQHALHEASAAGGVAEDVLLAAVAQLSLLEGGGASGDGGGPDEDAHCQVAGGHDSGASGNAGGPGGGSDPASPSSSAATGATAMHARLGEEPIDDGILGPIAGVGQAELLSIAEAAERTGIADVDMHAFMAAEFAASLRAADQLGELTVDEAAAITLYTMECELYRTLNRLLRARDRQQLRPFFSYLRLLLQARAKLPKHAGSLWRGVKGVDLRSKFPQGKELWWWAFTSTTKALSTLSNDMFLGKTGVRTVFMIETSSGVDIMPYSIFQGDASEAEVLLFPGTKLVVVDNLDMGNGLFQVHLRELPTPQLIK